MSVYGDPRHYGVESKDEAIEPMWKSALAGFGLLVFIAALIFAMSFGS